MTREERVEMERATRAGMADTQVAFSQAAYSKIVGHLDDVLKFMIHEFGKSEEEAQAWMKEFINGHYFPVWRAMNPEAPRADGQ